MLEICMKKTLFLSLSVFAILAGCKTSNDSGKAKSAAPAPTLAELRAKNTWNNKSLKTAIRNQAWSCKSGDGASDIDWICNTGFTWPDLTPKDLNIQGECFRDSAIIKLFTCMQMQNDETQFFLLDILKKSPNADPFNNYIGVGDSLIKFKFSEASQLKLIADFKAAAESGNDYQVEGYIPFIWKVLTRENASATAKANYIAIATQYLSTYSANSPDAFVSISQSLWYMLTEDQYMDLMTSQLGPRTVGESQTSRIISLLFTEPGKKTLKDGRIPLDFEFYSAAHNVKINSSRNIQKLTDALAAILKKTTDKDEATSCLVGMIKGIKGGASVTNDTETVIASWTGKSYVLWGFELLWPNALIALCELDKSGHSLSAETIATIREQIDLSNINGFCPSLYEKMR
jgi:hypothetical protein